MSGESGLNVDGEPELSLTPCRFDVVVPTEFTGISAPYEAPTSPEIHIRTDEVDVTQAVKIIADYLEKEGLIPSSA